MFRYAHIELNHAVCNLSCRMCSVNGRRPGAIDIAAKTGFLRELGECNLIDPSFILCVFGGEPLLCMDELCGLLEYTKVKNINNCIVSNGTLLTDETFIGLADSGLRNLCISLDSHKPEIHNLMRNSPVFDTVVRNIRNALAARGRPGAHISIRTNILINKLNLQSLPEYVDFCLNRLRVDNINLIFMDKLYFNDNKAPFFDEVFIDDLNALEKILLTVAGSLPVGLTGRSIGYIVEYHRRVLGLPPDPSFECVLYEHNVILDAEGNFKLCFPYGAGSQIYREYGDLKRYCFDKIPEKQRLVRDAKCSKNCFIKRHNLSAVLDRP